MEKFESEPDPATVRTNNDGSRRCKNVGSGSGSPTPDTRVKHVAYRTAIGQNKNGAGTEANWVSKIMQHLRDYYLHILLFQNSKKGRVGGHQKLVLRIRDVCPGSGFFVIPDQKSRKRGGKKN
jgi:hypothetical protein